MKPVLVIQNDAKEGAGLLASLLTSRGFRQMTVLGWQADYASPDASLSPANFSGLVVLGGAQGVNETEAYPYLSDEINLIQYFIAAGIPVIGLCLGAQLLAAALGGRVQSNTSKELGWHDITLSEAGRKDRLMSAHPEKALAFHFHGDYFTVPPGCLSLASSAMTGCQLFRHNNAYGFQYHAEVDMALIEVMCLNNVDYMAANGADAVSVIEQSRLLIEDYMQRSANILNAWIDLMEEANEPHSNE